MKGVLGLLLAAVLLLLWHFILLESSAGSTASVVQAAPAVPADGGAASGQTSYINKSGENSAAGGAVLGSKTSGAGGAAKTQSAASCGASHTVQAGESLGRIARRCGIPLGVVIAANPDLTNPDHILVGQKINLTAPRLSQPPAGQPLTAEQVASANNAAANPDATNPGAATSTAIGGRTTPDSSTTTNPGTAGSRPVPVTGASSAGTEVYTVNTGDTLAAIARRVGLSVDQLMWANPTIHNPNLISAGQQIKLPAPGSAPSQYDWAKARIQQGVQNQQAESHYQPKSANEHWVHVDLATQTLQAYSGNQLVRSFLVSTGVVRYPTVTGQYRIWIKLRSDEMVGPGYDLKNVPYVMYFYKGYGLHGTYWHHNFGTPMSHGCVNLATPDAAWLYNFLSVGSMVEVQ